MTQDQPTSESVQDEDEGKVTYLCHLGIHGLCSGALYGDKDRHCRCLCHDEALKLWEGKP